MYSEHQKALSNKGSYIYERVLLCITNKKRFYLKYEKNLNTWEKNLGEWVKIISKYIVHSTQTSWQMVIVEIACNTNLIITAGVKI